MFIYGVSKPINCCNAKCLVDMEISWILLDKIESFILWYNEKMWIDKFYLKIKISAYTVYWVWNLITDCNV